MWYVICNDVLILNQILLGAAETNNIKVCVRFTQRVICREQFFIAKKLN